MKIIACVAVSAALSFASAWADLTMVQQIEGGPVGSMTMKIKGDKARIDATPEMATIIDSKSGEILNLMIAQKKFMRVTAAQAKAAAEMAMQSDEKSTPVVKPKLVPTGKKETINGYETQEYVCDAPALKGSYWICPNYPGAAGILKQLAATTPQSWNVAAKGMPDYRDFPGLPLRTRVSFKGREIVSTLVSIKQDPLPDSDFVPPAGFEEFKMPDMDSLLGGKPHGPSAAPSPKS